MPKGSNHAKTDATLYDQAGRLILANAEFEGFRPPRLRWGTPLTRPINPKFLPRMGKAIYGGVVTDHYGHFLTGCLNTLWYYSKHAQPDDKVVFIANISPAEMFAIPWMARLFALAGVHQEMVIVPTSSCVFEKLVVPGQAVCDDAFVYTEFGEYCRNIGDSASDRNPTGGACWLSKTGLTTGNVFIHGEDELEAYLAQRDIEVIKPQNIDIDSQIALFRSGAVITGFIGSAFHTSVFSPSSRTVAFSPDPYTRRTYQLVDSVSNGASSYLHVKGLESEPPYIGFNASFRVTDVPAMGEAILKTIAIKKARPATRRDPLRSNTTLKPVTAFRAYSVKSRPFGQLWVDPVSGHLYAQDAVPHPSIEAHLLLGGQFAFLVSADQERPAIAVIDDGYPSPVVSYLAEFQADGTLALRDLLEINGWGYSRLGFSDSQ